MDCPIRTLGLRGKRRRGCWSSGRPWRSSIGVLQSQDSRCDRGRTSPPSTIGYGKSVGKHYSPSLSTFPRDIIGGRLVELFDGMILGAFVAFGFFCWLRRISYRVSVIMGLTLLGAAGITSVVSQERASDFVATIAFYFLAVGGILAIVDYVSAARLTAKPGIIRSDPRTMPREGEVTLRERLSVWLQSFGRN